MSDAPERIWAFYATHIAEDEGGATIVAYETVQHGAAEYVRANMQPTVSPDVIEIDIRAVMMERIEEAASQSPWVPPEYAMNEVISDCCSFLREPRDPSPKQLAAQPDDVAALVTLLARAKEELRMIRMKDSGAVYDVLLRTELDAALARVKGVM